MKQAPHPQQNTALMNRISKAKCEGYTSDFKVVESGLFLKENAEFFFPDQVKINESFYFDNAGDPSEEVILYLIETTDGHKGILINAHDTYADPLISSLIKQVQEISKK
jgi:hypothetical protein